MAISKIQLPDNSVQELRDSRMGNAKIFYGTCDTAAATVAKVVTCPEFTQDNLVKGALIFVTFDYTNSAGNITMNVNTTGAKGIRKQFDTDSPDVLTYPNELQANSTYLFQYNGTYWVCINIIDDYASKKYIISRSENLVTNGYATLGNNTNFDDFTFNGADAYGSGGCFTKTNSTSSSAGTSEFMPVDITQVYRLQYAVKNTTSTQTYDYVKMYDIDKHAIEAGNVAFRPGSTTTLAQDLNNGDTVVYLTDVSGWNLNGNNYSKGFIFWNYKNSKGYQYPIETYSRNWWYNLWDDSSVAINVATNTITLKTAWTHGTFEAGTSVSQSGNTGSNMYGNSAYVPTMNEWTIKTALFYPSRFRVGTAYIRLGWLINYSKQTNNIFSLTAVSFTQNANVSDVENKITKISSTTNAVPKFSGTTGELANTAVTINSSNQITSAGFIKSGGTASQFLKANGSVDSNTYITSASLPSAMSASEANTGTATTARTISASVLSEAIDNKLSYMTTTEVTACVNTIFS